MSLRMKEKRYQDVLQQFKQSHIHKRLKFAQILSSMTN